MCRSPPFRGLNVEVRNFDYSEWRGGTGPSRGLPTVSPLLLGKMSTTLTPGPSQVSKDSRWYMTTGPTHYRWTTVTTSKSKSSRPKLRLNGLVDHGVKRDS